MNRGGFGGRMGAMNNPNNMAENKKMDGKTTRSIILRLFGYIMKYWYLFLVAIAFTFASNQLALMGPEFSGNAIDAIAGENGVDFPAVWENVKYMIICYVLAAVMSYALSVIMIKISQSIVRTMRKQLFEKLTSLPVGFFYTTATGDIISRISYDIDTVNASLSHDLIQVMTSIYTVVGSLIFMWRISPPMIIVFVLTVPISIIFTRYRSKKVRPLFRARSRKLGELNGYAEEMLSGCRTIKAYNREAEIGARFDARNKDAMDAFYNAEYHGAALGPCVNFINNLSISLVMIFGGILYMYSQNGTFLEASAFFITLGGVSKFVQYSRKFAGPINEFANILHEFQSAFSAAERVFRILDEEPEKADAAGAKVLAEVNGDVDFKNVTFGYVPEKTILRDISVHAEPGKMIAIVGPTGAGKTTIINLLMRFYDVNSGTVTVDGEDMYGITRASLRHAYTMVLQDTWLFHGTIYENIVYGKQDATRAEVERAAKAAKIHNYIMKLPEGYDTVLSYEGVNISK
ncbi:MAG: ABC transporter ATP-binding protein, partial [Clostridia bacterium]|nr:ABC transporter ATP-binding protein [Clostridia bacterium]